MANITHPEEFKHVLPYLIQRLVLRDPQYVGDRTGVDRYFGMDYMGSSEFEWGALPNSLKVLRASRLVGPVKVKAVRDGEPVTGWYIGPEESRAVAEYWFRTTLATKEAEYGFDLKERSQLHGAYGPDMETPKSYSGRKLKPRLNYDRKTVGWWCVDGGYRDDPGTPNWVIFREKEHADKWVDGLTEPKPGK